MWWAATRSLPNLKVSDKGPRPRTGAPSLRLWAAGGLGRLGQRCRVVGERVEIGDDVGALAAALDAGEGHVGAGNVAARIGDELVELVDGPIAALRLHRGGIVEARLRRLSTADHAIEVGADQVAPALGEGVAGRAFLGRVLAAADVGLGKQLLDRLLFFRLRGLAGRRLLRHPDLVAGLGRLHRREDGAGGDVDREHAETGAQDGSEDFVHFKGVHRLKARGGLGNYKRRPHWIAAVHK